MSQNETDSTESKILTWADVKMVIHACILFFMFLLFFQVIYFLYTKIRRIERFLPNWLDGQLRPDWTRLVNLDQIV